MGQISPLDSSVRFTKLLQLLLYYKNNSTQRFQSAVFSLLPRKPLPLSSTRNRVYAGSHRSTLGLKKTKISSLTSSLLTEEGCVPNPPWNSLNPFDQIDMKQLLQTLPTSLMSCWGVPPSWGPTVGQKLQVHYKHVEPETWSSDQRETHVLLWVSILFFWANFAHAFSPHNKWNQEIWWMLRKVLQRSHH